MWQVLECGRVAFLLLVWRHSILSSVQTEVADIGAQHRLWSLNPMVLSLLEVGEFKMK